MAETNLSNQTLKSRTVKRRSSRAPEIVVNDDNLLTHPTELAGAVSRRVLQACRLLMLQNLADRGLPDVDYRVSVTMPGMHLLGGHQKGWAWRDRVHHPSLDPLLQQDVAEPARQPERSGAVAVPAN